MTAAPVAYQYPWGTEMVVRSSAPNTPEITTTITLFNQEKRIAFKNVVHKVATLNKEAIYFAFPFSLVQPRVNYQSATAWVDPERDMLPGANLQWFASQGGVWMSGTNNSVGWASADAPLVTFGDINRGLWPSSIKIKNGTVFSYVMNNYWYTDTPAQQGGQFTFRYSLTSGPRTSATDVLRLSAETRSPLVPIRRYSMGWEPTQPQKGRSFLTAGPSGVKVLTIRPLDHVRDSFLIRLQNSTAAKLHAELNFSGIEVAEAFRATPIGDRIDVLDTSSTGITIPLGSYDIQTIIVQVRRRP
jgi:hypothetical protein